MQWFRSYIGMHSDPKFGVVAKIAEAHRTEALAVWQAVLERARQHDGIITSLDEDCIAVGLELELDKVQRILSAMKKRGMLSEKPCDGDVTSLSVTAWHKRQYESDSSASRMRKHREHKKEGKVTSQKRHVTGSDAPEQNKTDSETDQNLSIPFSMPVDGIGAASMVALKHMADTQDGSVLINGRPLQTGFNFNIESHLTESDREEIRRRAPGWALPALIDAFNTWVKTKEKPTYPVKAFFGWLEKYVKDRRPS